MANTNSVIAKLIKAQTKIKAPKNQYNSFGKYHYRSVEDIQQACKPIMSEVGLLLTLKDELVEVGGRFYVKATATVADGAGEISVYAYAREDAERKGMSGSQVTGTASSYARKYALGGLLLLDDTQDDDSGTTSQPATTAKPSKPVTTATTAKANKPVTTASKPSKPEPNSPKAMASDIVRRYAELHNRDEKTLKQGILKRPDYADTDAFWIGIYHEFKDDIERTKEEAQNVKH